MKLSRPVIDARATGTSSEARTPSTFWYTLKSFGWWTEPEPRLSASPSSAEEAAQIGEAALPAQRRAACGEASARSAASSVGFRGGSACVAAGDLRASELRQREVLKADLLGGDGDVLGRCVATSELCATPRGAGRAVAAAAR
eukprot:CAMPEP_0115508618 /NCGR_PEP_ID=MMETSP0271-20121206/72398_1 /TAXON_ID=71861 /ORGANISM="Scrippsiella trochoidea, Strain CCMP3099" /LENGTH=142 /DNA_ID=CAMNT_0002938373 /DNA_START=232 /DNA_END=656 /DNA_ORIENTATION=-